MSEIWGADPRTAITVTSGYMSSLLDEEPFLKMAREQLADVDFDTIVGRGLSGGIAAPLIAHVLGKNWLVVRKPDVRSHAWAKAEGRLGNRWIFVDDFIGTGATRDAVVEAVAQIAQAYDWKTAHVGDFLYQRDGFVPVGRRSPRTRARHLAPREAPSKAPSYIPQFAMQAAPPRDTSMFSTRFTSIGD